MVIDNTMKAYSELGQNDINVFAIQTKTNDTKLTLHVLHNFITRLSINNTDTDIKYNYSACIMTPLTVSVFFLQISPVETAKVHKFHYGIHNA